MAYKADRSKKKVVFFGDSITQQGGLQGGYITLLKQRFKEENKDNYQLVNAGISGNKVDDLIKRIDQDVIVKSPDVVVLMIGINDVWHKMQGMGNDIDFFEVTYRDVLVKLLRSDVKLVVCTPTLIGEQQHGYNHFDDELDAFSNVVRNLASEYQLPLCDLRKAFTNYCNTNNPENKFAGILTTDGVHLNARGNALLAEYLWDNIMR